MAWKDSKLYSIFTFTCPRCHEGALFATKRSYSTDLARMNKSCDRCGEDFVREPGYYFGAAYVSYGLTVALWVALFVALVTFNALGIFHFSIVEDWILFLILGVMLLIVLMPVLYRLSRVIWINMFVKYRGNEADSRSRAEKSAV